MSNNNNTQTCKFNSNKYSRKISKIGNKVSILKTNNELILCEMFLCIFHYNKFILNENCKLQKILQVCSYPKHEIYFNHSNKKSNFSLINIPKRFINILKLDKKAKICNR